MATPGFALTCRSNRAVILLDRTNAHPTSHRGQAPKKLDIYSTGDRRVALIALLVILISLTLFVIHVLFVFLTPLSPEAECRIYTAVVPA